MACNTALARDGARTCFLAADEHRIANVQAALTANTPVSASLDRCCCKGAITSEMLASPVMPTLASSPSASAAQSAARPHPTDGVHGQAIGILNQAASADEHDAAAYAADAPSEWRAMQAAVDSDVPVPLNVDVELCRWASDRAQVLSRTVRGVMRYGEGLRVLLLNRQRRRPGAGCRGWWR